MTVDVTLDYSFTKDWFSHNVRNWTSLFSEYVGKTPRILEIGSFEGRSAVWLVERLALHHGGGELLCVDTWKGSDEHRDIDMDAVEQRFRHNLSRAAVRHPSVKLRAMKMPSLLALARLIAGKQTQPFDFIYIDGGHRAPEVLTDLVLSFALCKMNGIIAFDDYLWKFTGNPLDTPRMALDFFANSFAEKLEPIRHKPLYQVYFRKTAN